MTRPGRLTVLAVAMTAAIVLSAPGAHAAPAALFLAGNQWSRDGDSAYLGWIRPVAGGRLGQGWFVRPWLSYTSYRYHGAPGLVSAHVPGASLGGGYAWSGRHGSRSLSLAPGYQDTRLHPDDPGNSARGGQAFVLAQGQWRQRLAPAWDSRLIANYALGSRNYWTRLRLGYHAGARAALGPSFVYQGGPDYHGWQAGAFLDWALTRRWQVGVAGGYLKYAGVSGEGYAALTVGVVY